MLTDIEVKKKFDILSNKLQAGLFEEVIKEALVLLKKRQHQVFFNILSLAYQAVGKYQESADIMEEALRMNANNPYFLNNMGITQHKLENFSIAEEYFKRGLKIAPNYINIFNNLANLKKDSNFTDEAIDYYKKSISVKDDVIETHINIASCYQSIGKFDESIFHLNKVLKLNSKFTVADRLISSMKKYKDNDTHLNDMNTKISNPGLNMEEQSNLYFALGKAYEDLKYYDKSFQNYKKGNDLLKKMNPFNINNEIDNFKKIKEFFLDTKKMNISKNSRKIIFIVGMPRSGTSLVEQILSSHSNVYGGGELVFLNKIIKKNFLDNYQNTSLKDISGLEDLISKSHDEYIGKISIFDNTKKDFTDKAPLNFKFIGFIKNIFPNSKIINCKRDPLDTLWSNFKHYFPASLPFSNNLDDLFNYYKVYINYMEFWKKDFNKDIYNIDYEKLVQYPKDQIKDLLKFCDLEWDEKCMKHEKNSRSIKTASATQARKPIYKSAIKSSELFKNYLNEISKKLIN